MLKRQTQKGIRISEFVCTFQILPQAIPSFWKVSFALFIIHHFYMINTYMTFDAVIKATEFVWVWGCF